MKSAHMAVGMAVLLASTAVLAADLEIKVPAPATAQGLPAVVWAVPLSGHVSLHSGGSAIIDQVNKQFVPQVSVIETGTAVTFPNKDNIRHHVYSFSPAKTFELKLYSGKPANPVTFDHPGVVTLGCNIHDVMLGYVLVVDTPYHAVGDAKGVARLRDLPPGDYQLHTWVPGDRPGELPVQPLHVGSMVDATRHLDVAMGGSD